MMKKDYQTPTTKLIELQHRTRLLQTSGSAPKTMSGQKGEDSDPDIWRDLE